MSEEKELLGENGAFDTETSGFGGDVRERSARKRPKSGKRQNSDFRKNIVVREKVKVGNRPKSWVKSLRTTVGRRGWGRRHENGAFDTEIFR